MSFVNKHSTNIIEHINKETIKNINSSLRKMIKKLAKDYDFKESDIYNELGKLDINGFVLKRKALPPCRIAKKPKITFDETKKCPYKITRKGIQGSQPCNCKVKIGADFCGKHSKPERAVCKHIKSNKQKCTNKCTKNSEEYCCAHLKQHQEEDKEENKEDDDKENEKEDEEKEEDKDEKEDEKEEDKDEKDDKKNKKDGKKKLEKRILNLDDSDDD